jgi:hypothetical protein
VDSLQWYLPSFWGESLADRSKNHCPLCSLVWQDGLGRMEGNPCGWSAGTLTEFAEENWNWKIPQPATSRCLLTEKHHTQRDVFRLANYVCHQRDPPTERGGISILVRRGLTQLEATAILITLSAGPMKTLAA